MSEFVVVIGRFTPIGEVCPTGDRYCQRHAALLAADGTPMCRTVQLERIVQQPAVSAEQAHKEFLDLTE